MNYGAEKLEVPFSARMQLQQMLYPEETDYVVNPHKFCACEHANGTSVLENQ